MHISSSKSIKLRRDGDSTTLHSVNKQAVEVYDGEALLLKKLIAIRPLTMANAGCAVGVNPADMSVWTKFVCKS